ncbi:MAG: LPXTG cell wall anchor domain-containing protein [Actinobacteria bacterium]|nr:LPXTG cell wall anchor domain-containing protein [Actinomycetota bacterium]
MTATGSGCPANAAIQLTLNGQVQTTSTADPTGAFNFRWTTATTLQSGTYPLTLTCGGQSLTHQYTISASTAAQSSTGSGSTVGSGSLPVTGDDSLTLFLIGVGLVMSGSAVLAIARRHQPAES